MYRRNANVGGQAFFKLVWTASLQKIARVCGWTKYSNDVLKPDEPLDPDLVKALIASESSFELHPLAPNAGIAGKAHGLIQLTDQTIKALGDPNGELLNHLVKISTEDTSDPNLSIGAGIRWLFRKRDLASHRFKRQATWQEGIAEDFEMFVKSDSISHIYHGRRRKPVIYCDEFKTAWNRLTKGEEYICIDGDTLTKLVAPSQYSTRR